MGYFSLDRDKVNRDIRHLEYLMHASKEQQFGVKYLYDRLNIIDNKMNSLLRLNGIIVGFLSASMFFVLRGDRSIIYFVNSFLLLCIVIYITLGISLYLSYDIFHLRFDRVYDRRSFNAYKQILMKLTFARERNLHISSALSRVGVMLFSISFIVIAITEIFPLGPRLQAYPQLNAILAGSCVGGTSCP